MFVVVYLLYHLNLTFPHLVFWNYQTAYVRGIAMHCCYTNLQIVLRFSPLKHFYLNQGTTPPPQIKKIFYQTNLRIENIKYSEYTPRTIRSFASVVSIHQGYVCETLKNTPSHVTT